jgi:hypothetical protein
MLQEKATKRSARLSIFGEVDVKRIFAKLNLISRTEVVATATRRNFDSAL